MQTSLRKIKFVLEGLPNIDNAYLLIELQAKQLIPLSIEQIKNGTQNAYILEYDLDAWKSKIVNITKVNTIAHQRIKLSYYVDQNCEIKIKINEKNSIVKVNPCSRCQVYGHEAYGCKQPIKCGKCARSHFGRECVIDLKTRSQHKLLVCANCDGNHTAFSKACPVYRDVQNNYRLHAGDSFDAGFDMYRSRSFSKTSLMSYESGTSSQTHSSYKNSDDRSSLNSH